MSVFILASLITSFIAGVAALFAPCCISVLLPSYLGSIFRERYKVVAMTFIYFLGVLTVFLPIGFGFAYLAQFFKDYHGMVYFLGGSFMAILGLMVLTNNGFSLPFSVHPQLKKHNSGSVYVLGIFSGIATTCCAPVLAGVLALSALPGSVFWGGLYTVVYVIGMVAPLFFIALIADKTKITQKMMLVRKPFVYTLLGKHISITWAQLMSGGIFLIMGFYTIYTSFIGPGMSTTDYQISMNIYFAKLLKVITVFITPIANYIWIAIGVIIITLIVKAVRGNNKKIITQKDEDNI
ncbi:MAG: cytochrome c biogenesis CcdA family protein [Candidatus Moranbacteria bacterium]|nr:cytochrome c biogenesis CcdA family protein [Candidatus Moranbacteria bacterium]